MKERENKGKYIQENSVKEVRTKRNEKRLEGIEKDKEKEGKWPR